MMILGRPIVGAVLVAALVAAALLITGPSPSGAVEVGQEAPDFTLPSTTGVDISLRDFRGKKFVLLEFYGADFAPT